MKRIKVTLHLDGAGQAFCVEARCSKCVYWERKDPYEIVPPSHMRGSPEIVKCDRGYCYRYPDTENKHEDKWCGEFKPDV